MPDDEQRHDQLLGVSVALSLLRLGASHTLQRGMRWQGASIDVTGTDHQRLHALDVTTGAELLGGPRDVTAAYPAPGGGALNLAVPTEASGVIAERSC